MTNITVTVEETANSADETRIIAMLNEFNVSKGVTYNPVALSVFIRNDDGEVVAGLVGSTLWEWLRISILAVDGNTRTKGYGSMLMQAAEKEAVKRGCKYAWVDTFSFQAQAFYEKMAMSSSARSPTTRPATSDCSCAKHLAESAENHIPSANFGRGSLSQSHRSNTGKAYET
jgi:Acetyltransferase (GNAT) family.